MIFNKKNTIIFFILLIVCFCRTAVYAEKEICKANKNGKKLRIGYYEGDMYYEFTEKLKGLVDALEIIGFINKEDVFKQYDASSEKSAKKLWSLMSTKIKSNCLEFVDDAFWSSENEGISCDINKESIYKKTVIDRDVDLMIAAGTVAGKCLSSEIKGYDIDTLVMTASNPVLSGIVNNYEYSGKEHIHAIIEKDKFYNEMNLFYKIYNFKRLGIVYRDKENEKVYAAVEDARNIEKDKKIQLIEEKIPENENDISDDDLKKITIEKYKILAEKKVDAVYITDHLDETEENIFFLNKIVAIFKDKKIATWSQTPRSWMVKYGILMSLDGADPLDIGMFEAKVIKQILSEKKPGEINQVFVNPKKESVTLNLETAQNIQLDLSLDVLASATVYENNNSCKDTE